MNENPKPKRKRGGQKGNQNARTHGRYSLIIPPRTLEVLKAVRELDVHGQRVIYTWLLRRLLDLKSEALFESHSSCPVPEKAEPIPLEADFAREFSAWAQERNVADESSRHGPRINDSKLNEEQIVVSTVRLSGVPRA